MLGYLPLVLFLLLDFAPVHSMYCICLCFNISVAFNVALCFVGTDLPCFNRSINPSKYELLDKVSVWLLHVCF